jgi:membrane protease YdiL (CAAX protease family)
VLVAGPRAFDWLAERYFAIRRRAHQTVAAWRAQAGSTPGTGWTIATLVLLAGLPAAKWLQVAHHTGGDWWRQLIVVAVLAIAVGVRYGRHRSFQALATWQVAWPAPGGGPSRQWGADGRPVRLGVAVLAVASAAAVGVVVTAGWEMSDGATAALLVGALVSLGLVAVVEYTRQRAWERCRDDALRTAGPGSEVPVPPDRAVLWAIAPGLVVWCTVLLIALARATPLDATMTGDGTGRTSVTPLLAGGGGRLLFTFLVVGLGEELIYRGLLLALVIANRLDQFGAVLVSISFAAWHLPDAWGDAGEVVAVLAATFLASHLALIPVRLRSRTLTGPVLLHTATNASLLLL